MITTSTVTIYTGIAPRWLAVLGYGLSLPLLFSSYYFSWSSLFSALGVSDQCFHSEEQPSAGFRLPRYRECILQTGTQFPKRFGGPGQGERC